MIRVGRSSASFLVLLLPVLDHVEVYGRAADRWLCKLSLFHNERLALSRAAHRDDLRTPPAQFSDTFYHLETKQSRFL